MTDKIDILNRQKFVDQLVSVIRQLADNGNGCTFAIDGQWGSGKSYVLDMLEKEINLFQDPNAAGDRYIVFRYDCWQYDYYDEPAIAIIAAIRDACEKYNQLLPKVNPEVNPKVKAAFETAKDLGKELVYNVMETKIGWSPESIIKHYEKHKDGVTEDIEKNHKYDAFFEFKSILTKTRDQLSKMAKDKPIIIIVDELDRCIPEYAIKVLERLHHLFENQSNIIVVLAYDGVKLNHVIRNIYGIEGRDVQHFMRKFIGFSFQLDNGQISNSFWELHKSYLNQFNFDTSNSNELKQLYEFSFKILRGTDVRTQEKIIDRIVLLHKFTFGELSHPSILYYELLHQVLLDKYSLQPISSWIFNMRKPSPPSHSEIEDALGLNLYEYIRATEESIHRQYITFGTGPKFYTISDDPLSLAFWYIAALMSPIKDNTCKKYYLNNAIDYQDIVVAAKKFDELAAIIK